MRCRGGENGPNYDAGSVAQALDTLKTAELSPHLMIDASHANCGKDCTKMPDVFREIVKQRAEGNTGITSAMLESNLVAGNQSFPRPLDELTYGQSITDQCIDWETTVGLLREARTAL